jgi:hypothetical protein
MEYVNIIGNSNIRRYYRDYFYSKANELRNNFKTQIFNNKTLYISVFRRKPWEGETVSVSQTRR